MIAFPLLQRGENGDCPLAAEGLSPFSSLSPLPGCTISVLAPAEVSRQPWLFGQWERLLDASENLYVMYQSPAWWEHLMATSDHRGENGDCPLAAGGLSPFSPLRLAVAEAGSGRLAGIAPLQLGQFELTFAAKTRTVFRCSLPVVRVLGGQPLLPPSEEVYARFVDSLCRSFPQAAGIYFKSVPENSFCADYLRSLGERQRKFLVYRPDGVRQFHGIKLPAAFDEYLQKFDRKKRYNLKRQERLLRERGNGHLELLRIATAEQAAGFVAAAAAIERHAWQGRSIGPRITDDAVTRKRLADAADCGLLRCYLLRSGPDDCAYVLGYQSHGVFHYADIGFDDRLASFSPGAVLLYLLIADLTEHRPPRTVNLGIGDSGYKEQFGNLHCLESSVLLLRASPANRLRVAAHSALRHVARQAKSLLRRREGEMKNAK